MWIQCERTPVFVSCVRQFALLREHDSQAEVRRCILWAGLQQLTPSGFRLWKPPGLRQGNGFCKVHLLSHHGDWHPEKRQAEDEAAEETT
ncbi:MAG: hypothetical protein NVSMB3_08650 [Acidobacteriaceae bacterium]